MQRTTAIVGGGMLGLTLALRLARQGHAVTVYEAADEGGGLASGWTWDGIAWDRHYHVILPGDGAVLALLADLDLADAVEWHAPKTAFFAHGRMHRFTTLLDQARFPVLSIAEKARLWSMIQRTRRLTDWQSLAQQPVETWLRRECGDRVFERVWRPLLRAKLGDAYREVSASFLWATVQRLYGNGVDRPPSRFGYLRCGYAAAIVRLTQTLREHGVQVRCGTPVHRVTAAAGGFLAVSAGDATRVYERVAVTLAPAIAARICAPLSDEERDRLRSIAYQGIVCPSLLLDRPLGDAYVTNVADETIPFTAVVEMSALCGTLPFKGRHLVYLPRYCSPQDALFLAGDATVRERVTETLSRLYPGFSPGSVRAFRVSRVPAVFALPTPAYFGCVPGLSTSRRGLYLASSAQIVNGTLNVNETLELAARAAAHMIGDPRYAEGALHETAG